MDNELLIPRLKDLANSVYVSSKPKFLGFLSVEEVAFAKKFLENQNVNFEFFGGEHSAQRMMLCCFPEQIKKPIFPIVPITFSFRMSDSLRHRDFLGALMGLGLKREAVGDILIEAGRAVVFVKNEIADYVLENVTLVGRVGVTTQRGYSSPLPETDVLKENTQTVASCRLDCVVAAITTSSRNTAIQYIESGLVSVNSQVITKPTKMILNGDVLSIRHKGKFQIISTDKRTKKDRIVLVYNSY